MRKEMERIKDTLYGTGYCDHTKEEIKEDMEILLKIINTTKNKNLKCECACYYNELFMLLEEKEG